jgi:hypothetical protein
VAWRGAGSSLLGGASWMRSPNWLNIKQSQIRDCTTRTVPTLSSTFPVLSSRGVHVSRVSAALWCVLLQCCACTC